MAETKRRAPAVFDRTLGEWQPTPQYVAFPEFQEPPLPANPVIGYRYGQDVLLRLEAFVAPRHLPFPYWQEPPVEPARLVIPFLRGQWIGDELPPLVGTAPRHFPFPYFEQPPPPLASPVIAFRYGKVGVWPADIPVTGLFIAFPFVVGEAPPAPSTAEDLWWCREWGLFWSK